MKVNTYKTITLLGVLYGCKTWSLTLRVDQVLKVFGNEELRMIFEGKRDKIEENGESYIMLRYMHN